MAGRVFILCLVIGFQGCSAIGTVGLAVKHHCRPTAEDASLDDLSGRTFYGVVLGVDCEI